MSPLSPAGVMGTTGSRCRSPRVLLALMILSFPAGFATHPAINIIVHSYLRIQPVSSVTRTASRSGPILGIAINAALLEVLMAEGQDMVQSQIVRVMLLIMLIRTTIILN
jgi:hypothetical protein